MSAPNVKYKEKNLSYMAPSGDGLTVAIVVPAPRGPVNKPIIAGGRTRFLNTFTPRGKVEVGFPTSFYSALTVLEATGNVYVVRAAPEDALYGGVTVTDGAITPLDMGSDNPDGHEFTTESFALFAADQGAWSKRLLVSIFSYKEDEPLVIGETGNIVTTQKWGKGYPVRIVGKNIPSSLNSQTTYFITKNAQEEYVLVDTLANALSEIPEPIVLTASDIQGAFLSPAVQYAKTPETMAIRVFEDGDLNNPVVEYVVSKTPGALDADGYSLYLEDAVSNSTYLKAVDNVLVSDTYVEDIVVPVRLAGGSDGSAVTDGDMVRALNTLSNPNEYQFKLILDGGRITPAYQVALTKLAETRGDCVAIKSAKITSLTSASQAQDIIDYRKYEVNENTSYAAMYAPHVKILDEFNNREVWVAPDGFVAKAIVETNSNYEIWYPVGGDRRGVVNALDTRAHFTEADQDVLYDSGINPIVFEAGNGIKIWGQKTLSTPPSMLDRLNVRLLLVTIGPDIKRMLKSFIMEFNDEATRATAKAQVDAYMEGIVARRGVTKFVSICDETNNTSSDIDNHIMRLDLLVCPNGSVEYIPFTIGIVNNSISFDLAQEVL